MDLLFVPADFVNVYGDLLFEAIDLSDVHIDLLLVVGHFVGDTAIPVSNLLA